MSFGRNVQSRIFRDGVSGTTPLVPTAWPALEAAAKRALPRNAWAYLAGSAGAESTSRANHDALDEWRIVPRVLRDVAERDSSIELLGHQYPTPLFAAPVGVIGLMHRDADPGVARAAAENGVPYILSTQASTPMEVTAVAMGEAPFWYQLYWSSSRQVVASMVGRAERCGARAIVVTLDTHTLGWRPRDLDLGYLPFAHGQGLAQYTSDPAFLELASRPRPAGESPRVTAATIRTLIDITRGYPGRFRDNLRSPAPRAAVDTFLETFPHSHMTWGDIAWLRQLTSLPIVIKGIQHPDDAGRAVSEGLDAVIVSNHAGRQLDHGIASIDALPGVVDAIDGRMPVLFDSGIRSGSDMFIALALGATAVCVGRAYAYGLSIAGEAGASEVFRNLLAEFDITMALAGVRSVDEITAETVSRRPR